MCMSAGGLIFLFPSSSNVVLMYCVSPKKRDNWGRSMSQIESNFLNGMDSELYSVNPPQWDDDIRSMLAQTIGKRMPSSGNDDVAIKNNSMKRPNDDDSVTSSSEIENCSFQGHSKKIKFNKS